jgi:iron complex outermembrane recepter protein
MARLLKSSVAISALIVLGSGAMAQQSDNAEVVLVTGSRIARPEIEMPTPVTSVSGLDITNLGTTNLTNYLHQLPALVGSISQTDTSGYGTPQSDDGYSLAGLNLLDLRNLGYVRTLVLVDGHRQVSSSMGSAAVDVNTIPISLIDRVDITTGGASAIYGADGVSGVVNFVMNHNLKGLRANVQGGITQFGGANTLSGSVSYGLSTDDDKGNIAVAFEYASQGGLSYTKREYSRVGGFINFVEDPNGGPYTLVPSKEATFIWSGVNGAITSDPGFSYPDYTGLGQPYVLGGTVDGVNAVGGSGQPAANVLQGDLEPQTERYIAYLTGKYDFNERAKLTVDFKYAHAYTFSAGTPPYDDYTPIEADNAFLPSNVADAIVAGPNGFGYGLLSEDYLSLRRKEATYRDTYQVNARLTGDITPGGNFVKDLTYDLSLGWGRTDVDDVDVGNRIEDRFYAAFDSVKNSSGQAVCRSSIDPTAVPRGLADFGYDTFGDVSKLKISQFPATFTPGPNSGCVAFNPFDPDPSHQQAAIAWITHDTHTIGHINQTVISGSLSGNLPFTEAVFAGPLRLVAGGEYRWEKSQAYGDSYGYNGHTFDPTPLDSIGSYDVGEAFTEAELPLIKNVTAIKDLSINGALRYSTYSTAGSTTTWSYGGVWAPMDSFRFRITDAYAVRAPNVGELYAPGQTGFDNVGDPCDIPNINGGTSYRAANCQKIMSALGVPYDPGVTNLNTGSTTELLTSGNTDLRPEGARTFTAGIVIQPTFLNSLAITVDWYRVTINNAIRALDGQDIAEECVDLSTIDNKYCGMITRATSGGHPGSISLISIKQINVATYETSGFDYTISYRADTQDWFDSNYGMLNVHITGNILNSLLTTAKPGEVPKRGVGQVSQPKYQMSFSLDWAYAQFDVNYNIDWFSSTYRLSYDRRTNDPTYMDPQYWKYPERFVNNVQIGYSPDDTYRFYFGVNNLFNQKPGFASATYPVDPIGRSFYFGIKLKTDGGLPGLPQF